MRVPRSGWVEVVHLLSKGEGEEGLQLGYHQTDASLDL